MHAHVLNHALLWFFEYAVVGPTEPSLLNDPFDTAGIEVQFLHDDREMSPHECEWHLQRFVREWAEATKRIEALRAWRPQLSRSSCYPNLCLAGLSVIKLVEAR